MSNRTDARGENNFATLSVPVDALERVGVFQGLLVPDATWTRRRQFTSSPAQRSAVVRSTRHFAAKVTRPDFGLSTDFGRVVLITFLAGIELGYANDLGRTTLDGIALVHKVEDWIDGQHVPSIDVLGMCNALNINLRTLQRAFDLADHLPCFRRPSMACRYARLATELT